MTERTDQVTEAFDLDPVGWPADGTWSPLIEGNGTGHALPPIDPAAQPLGAEPPVGDDQP